MWIADIHFINGYHKVKTVGDSDAISVLKEYHSLRDHIQKITWRRASINFTGGSNAK